MLSVTWPSVIMRENDRDLTIIEMRERVDTQYSAMDYNYPENQCILRL